MRRTATMAFAAAAFVFAVIGSAEARPTYGVCSGCHYLDSSVSVTATFQGCTGDSASYSVWVSDTYNWRTKYGVFDSADRNIANGTAPDTFTVPGGATYTVWGVANRQYQNGSNFTTISPDCSVPACTDGDGDGFFAESGCGTAVDCNDGSAAINPGAAESCTDGVDNDCDGLVDGADPDAVGCATCTDSDGDGFFAESGCGTAVDCNDGEAAVNPGAAESCTDGVDNDCDGLVDDADPDAVGCISCNDTDGDGYFAQAGCGTAVDCNDGDAAVNPGGTESCTDGIDNDCDGLVDGADPDAIGCTVTSSSAATTDFNGDGRSDILWRNQATGDIYLWAMEPSGYSVLYVGTVPDPAWGIAEMADFNGDGLTDILWRNSANGSIYVWIMNGATVTGSGQVGTLSDPTWIIIDVTDFNADGRADVLWYHLGSGAVHVWYMNGASIASSSAVGQVPDLNWKIIDE